MTPVRTPGSTLDPLEEGLVGAPALPSDFTDRVMRAVAAAPAPTPTRSFLAALRRGALRNAAGSVSVASHLVTVRTWPVAPRVRARSFALVLGVVFVLMTGSLAAAAAVRHVVPLRLGDPGAIEVSGPGAEARPTGRRPVAPRAGMTVETSAGPAVPGDGAVSKPAASKGPAGGDKADRPRAVPAGADGATDRDHGGSDDNGSGDADQGGDTSDDGGSGGSGGGSDGADDDSGTGPAATPDDSDERDGGDTGG
jgi:uncharacterized membrane protein YgcG